MTFILSNEPTEQINLKIFITDSVIGVIVQNGRPSDLTVKCETALKADLLAVKFNHFEQFFNYKFHVPLLMSRVNDDFFSSFFTRSLFLIKWFYIYTIFVYETNTVELCYNGLA